MPSRRRRLAALRVFGVTPHAADEPNGPGMDAPPEPQDADRDAVRPRSAPAFCTPRPVAPKPYRQTGAAIQQPRPAAPPRPAPPPRTPPPTVATSFYDQPRPSPALAMPPAASRPPETAPRRSFLYEPPEREQPAAPIRPVWDDAPDVADEPAATEAPVGPAWTAIARGVALFFGTLLAIDLYGGLPDGGPWWLDVRPLPAKAATAFLSLSAAALIAFGVRPKLPGPVRMIATLCLVLLIAAAFKNATVYYGLLKRGDLHAGPPVAFPLHVASCLGMVLIALRCAPRPGGFRDLPLALLGFNAALFALPVAQIACLGPVDARKPAAAVVVFAPRPFEKEPETRFDERMRTAVKLFETGLAPRLALAGGLSEERLARAKKLATDGGVPEASILILTGGEPATAELAKQFPAEAGKSPDLLAVSGFDHLPRLTASARRAGLKLLPVPAATDAKPDRKVLMRETVELWRSYFQR